MYVWVDVDVAEDGQWVESNIKQNKNLINVKSNMWIQVGKIYVEFWVLSRVNEITSLVKLLEIFVKNSHTVLSMLFDKYRAKLFVRDKLRSQASGTDTHTRMQAGQ